MKIIIALFLAVSVCGLCFSAEPVEGFWLSVDEKTGKVTAGWHIYLENSQLYGKIMSVATEPRGVIADKCRESYRGFPVSGKVNTMPVAGTPWIFGLTKNNRNGEWTGGRIINPEDGNDYNCRIIFHQAGTRAGSRNFQADTLEMRGEIGLGIGRSQYWQRTDERTAGSLWP
ncbi:MAG: DUF2147 domain-containing protein [Treponema sp.]|nr:DUF2147 domain-containing protein [Treponema sp.]